MGGALSCAIGAALDAEEEYNNNMGGINLNRGVVHGRDRAFLALSLVEKIKVLEGQIHLLQMVGQEEAMKEVAHELQFLQHQLKIT